MRCSNRAQLLGIKLDFTSLVLKLERAKPMKVRASPRENAAVQLEPGTAYIRTFVYCIHTWNVSRAFRVISPNCHHCMSSSPQ